MVWPRWPMLFPPALTPEQAGAGGTEVTRGAARDEWSSRSLPWSHGHALSLPPPREGCSAPPSHLCGDRGGCGVPAQTGGDKGQGSPLIMPLRIIIQLK